MYSFKILEKTLKKTLKSLKKKQFFYKSSISHVRGKKT